MKKTVKVNRKRLCAFIVIFVAIIAVIIISIVLSKRKNLTLDGSKTKVDGASITNNQEIEYDGNPYNVPQAYVETVNQYVDEKGNALEGADLSNVKNNIIDKFKSYSNEKLGFEASMDNIKIVFNQGTTTIAENTCIVFAVYEIVDDSLDYISKYAMSIDTNVIYKFDSEAFVFRMIQ